VEWKKERKKTRRLEQIRGSKQFISGRSTVEVDPRKRETVSSWTRWRTRVRTNACEPNERASERASMCAAADDYGERWGQGASLTGWQADDSESWQRAQRGQRVPIGANRVKRQQIGCWETNVVVLATLRSPRSRRRREFCSGNGWEEGLRVHP